MSHWVTKDGALLLYFVNHRKDSDTVESFEYRPSTKTLVYRRTFRDEMFYNLNDLVVVGQDRFYVSFDRYFKNGKMKFLEGLFRLPLGCILYCDGETTMVASENLRYPNGVAKSNDGRYIICDLTLCLLHHHQYTIITIGHSYHHPPCYLVYYYMHHHHYHDGKVGIVVMVGSPPCICMHIPPSPSHLHHLHHTPPYHHHHLHHTTTTTTTTSTTTTTVDPPYILYLQVCVC